MNGKLSYLAATVIVVATSLVQGFWTDRWKSSHLLQDAVKRIDLIPTSFGDWVSNPLEIDQRQLEAAGIVGSMMRRYENQRDKRSFNVLLVCGRPGPISVHTPDICYTGAGLCFQNSPAQATVSYGNPARTAVGWYGDFMKEASVVAHGLRIFWSWSPGDGWKAPTNPRLDYAGYRALYKLYVIRESNGTAIKIDNDPIAEFMKELLPELDRALAQTQTR